MKVTIKDVAKKAGVSITTVSRVFNGYSDISEKTKQHILKVAQEMNYTPNAAARTLSSKKQKTIALILNDLELNRKTTMPMEVLSGVYEYTVEHQIEFVFFATTSIKQSQKSFQQFCREKNITGAVIQGLRVDDVYYKELDQTPIPVVLIDIQENSDKVGSVSIDNIAAAKEAVNYLISLGHREIALINGRRQATVSMEREAGYLRALQEAEIPVKTDYVQYANFSEEIAEVMSKDLIQHYSEITAFFCASDLMAIGVMKGMQEMGLNIPDDISVIGFDDIILTEFLTPPLTTIHQDMKRAAYEAAHLVDQMMSEPDAVAQHVFIPHELVVRGSTKKSDI